MPTLGRRQSLGCGNHRPGLRSFRPHGRSLALLQDASPRGSLRPLWPLQSAVSGAALIRMSTCETTRGFSIICRSKCVWSHRRGPFLRGRVHNWFLQLFCRFSTRGARPPAVCRSHVCTPGSRTGATGGAGGCRTALGV